MYLPVNFRGVLVGVGSNNIIRSRISFGRDFGQVPYLRVFRCVPFRLLDRVCCLVLAPGSFCGVVNTALTDVLFRQ